MSKTIQVPASKDSAVWMDVTVPADFQATPENQGRLQLAADYLYANKFEGEEFIVDEDFFGNQIKIVDTEIKVVEVDPSVSVASARKGSARKKT